MDERARPLERVGSCSRAARRSACAPRRAPRARPRSAAAVGRASVGRDRSGTWWWPSPSSTSSSTRRKNGDGGWKTRRYVPGSSVRELADAAVGVGLRRGDELVAAVELDADAGRRAAARGVEDVGREVIGANLRACAALLVARSPPRRRGRGDRRARPPRRRRRAGRRGAAPRGRARRRGRRRRASSSPSVRQTARSARLPGSSEPMSSRRSTAAPPRVPSRSASRAVSAAGPPRPARDEQRLLDLEQQVAALVRRRAVDAEADAHARVEQVAHRRDARAEPEVRASGSARRRCRVAAKRATSSSDRWTQCAHQTSPASQPSDSRYSTGRAAVELAAVRLLLDRLGEVRVEHEPEPPRELGRLLHQLAA